ncbi:hypothetical protein PISMIDRAFT_12086 [Pisolithus microcarpus 441]|uniref:Unplaced genomic scaffold scaffold_63, whole genome shotgun sequence n=1 Tax=Pisolithus microcarpus 441 TaxID=765257 RepID=A0A0C9YYE9_9AGAM|nr:hypothetical protein PISMIDRAFT_12086 [Pisolithus microcarpus 441]
MCDDVPDFQQCDRYNALLNTCPDELFDSLSYDSPSTSQFSNICSQVDSSDVNTSSQIPPLGSFPSQSFMICRVSTTRNLQGKVSKGRDSSHSHHPYQSVLFADGSHPGGILAASARSSHEHGLEGLTSGSTLEVPQVHVTPAELPSFPDTPEPSAHGHLVHMLPNYLNYVWMLVIYDRGNPFDRKTEEQNDCIWILNRSHSLTPEVVAESIDRVLADLMINISTLQYKLVLELALIVSPEECHSFHNQEVEHYTEAKVRDCASEDTAATAGSSVAEKHPDIKVEAINPDPWTQEPIEFMADDGYTKRRDTSYSETAKFLSETTAFTASAFAWRSFLDAATWNKADHHLHNAINTTTPIPATTFHPIVVNSMLCIYLTGCTPVPLDHPLYEWTPATLPPEDENHGSCPSGPRLLRPARNCSPTPGLSVCPG